MKNVKLGSLLVLALLFSNTELTAQRTGSWNRNGKHEEGRRNNNRGNSEIGKSTSFAKNKKYYSSNFDYYLIFQNDGNLVLYNRNGSSRWASNTNRKGASAEFQQDGNLVVYNRSGKALFSTGTNTKGNVLIVQEDGNLVIYDRRKKAVWSSETAERNYNNSSERDRYKTRR